MVHSSRLRLSRRHLSRQRRIVWPASVIIFMLGTMVAVTACGDSSTPAPGTAAAATATASAAVATAAAATPPALAIKGAHDLTWKQHTLPANIKAGGMSFGVGFGMTARLAAADANTAYLCDLTASQIEIWATHDQSEHWARAATVDRTSGVTDCGIVVDENQPKQAILMALASGFGPRGSNGNTTSNNRSYVTSDGGTTWVKLAAPKSTTPIFTALASQGSTAYALVTTPTHGSAALYHSTDDMKTWARADRGVYAEKNGQVTRSVASFQMATTGEVLAAAQESGDKGGTTYELWHSTDSGAHWSKFAQTKDAVTASQDFLVPGNQGARFWRACGVSRTGGSRTKQPTMTITCTLDGGKTWQATGDGSSGKTVFAQAADGALLATTTTTNKQGFHITLMRVAPGQKKWESLGEVSWGLSLSYAPDAAGIGGTLWSQPTFAMGRQGLTVYTAVYP